MAYSPQQIGDILSELMARRGFARMKSAAALEEAWQQAAGPLAAEYSRVGLLRRGTLEVTVANSTLVQELLFQRPALLRTLTQKLPDEKIKDIRFSVGTIR